VDNSFNSDQFLQMDDSFQEDGKDGPKTLDKPKRHDRGVSWDQNVTDNDRSTPPRPDVPMQPLLPGDNDKAPSFMERTALRNQKLPPRPPTIDRKTSGGSNPFVVSISTRRLNLGNLDVDPLELEAENLLMELEGETSLMRELEERDPIRPDANTGNNLLSEVPLDQLQHNFSLDEPPHAPEPPARSRLMSADSTRTREKPAIPAKSTGKAHRRQMTVEETLFGLTSALTAINHVEARKNKSVAAAAETTSNRERADTSASTDRFGLLFRGMSKATIEVQKAEEKPPEDEPSAPKTEAQNRWSQLRENLDDYKKTDDQENKPAAQDDATPDDDTPDIELGVGSLSFSEDQKDTGDDDSKTSGRTWKFWKGKRKPPNPFRHLPYADAIKSDWDTFNAFLKPRKSTMYSYARAILVYLWLPAIGIANLLFYCFTDPLTGMAPSASVNATASVDATTSVDATASGDATASWWIMFLCVREVLIFCMAKCTEIFIIDFLALQTKATLRLCGPVITLLIVQSKGWPFMLLFWGIYNFTLVVGDGAFQNHWLYFQDFWGLCNESNPSGDVTSSKWFSNLCTVAVCVGIAVSVKRLLVGVVLGRQTFGESCADHGWASFC
jgi:hypothetical protein